MPDSFWRLIDSGFHSAEENLALDEALYDCFDSSRPWIRLYGWKDALSIGRFQTLEDILSVEKLESADLSWSRRISGGGVMLHELDLSYVILFPKALLPESGVKESYRYLCGFLFDVYKRLGITAKFSHDCEKDSSRHAVCHAAHEGYDLTVDGRKIGGNAQRWSREFVFQHGSIPLKLDLKKMNGFLHSPMQGDESISLETLGMDIGYDSLKSEVMKSLESYFDMRLESENLNLEEQERYKMLLEQKYRQDRWKHDAKTE